MHHSLLIASVLSLSLLFSCQSEEEMTYQTQVLAIEGACCSNLLAIEAIDLPDNCGNPAQRLHAINIAEFELL